MAVTSLPLTEKQEGNKTVKREARLTVPQIQNILGTESIAADVILHRNTLIYTSDMRDRWHMLWQMSRIVS